MNHRIIIWGLGKVGRALYEGFKTSGVDVDGIICRTTSKTESIQWLSRREKRPSDLSLGAVGGRSLPDHAIWMAEDILQQPENFLKPGDVVFVTVVDREIAGIFSRCDLKNVTLVHSSGATALISLMQGNSGVFYPLQTFAGDGKEEWQQIPVFIEGSNVATESKLIEIAQKMGVLSTEKLDSKQRRYLHLAGVFANNYTTAMAGIAVDLLSINGLNPQWILPILRKTSENLGEGQPWSLITGPAARADLSTLENHRSLMENQPEMLEAYNVIASYIMKRKSDASTDGSRG